MKIVSLTLVLGLAVVCSSGLAWTADAYCPDVMVADQGNDVGLATVGGVQPRVNFVSGKTDRLVSPRDAVGRIFTAIASVHVGPRIEERWLDITPKKNINLEYDPNYL